jgi:hypothetical protein
VALAAWVPAAHATITVTRADTFNPGFFWSTFTYTWTINVAASKGPYDDYEVWHTLPGWLANTNVGSYSGPGAIAGPQPAGGIRVRTLAPGGFTPPTTGSIDSVANPKFVAGKLNFQITLAGVPVNASVFASLVPLTPNSTTVAGSVLVAYPSGTFPPNVPIDLFQNTTSASQTAHLGFGMTDATGGASIPLGRSMSDPGSDELVVGLNGRLAYSVPTPGAGVMAVTGVMVMAWRRRR